MTSSSSPTAAPARSAAASSRSRRCAASGSPSSTTPRPDDSRRDDRRPRRSRRRARAAQRRLRVRLQPRRGARQRAATALPQPRRADRRARRSRRSSRRCAPTRAPRSSARGSSTTTARSPTACAASRACGPRTRRRSSCTALWPLARVDRRADPRPAVYERAGDRRVGLRRVHARAARRLRGLGGFDEGLFLYCEDTDLCRRLWAGGPRACASSRPPLVRHVGGASSGAGETQAIAARSRVHYARKHSGRAGARSSGSGSRSTRPPTRRRASHGRPSAAGTPLAALGPRGEQALMRGSCTRFPRASARLA